MFLTVVEPIIVYFISVKFQLLVHLSTSDISTQLLAVDVEPVLGFFASLCLLFFLESFGTLHHLFSLLFDVTDADQEEHEPDGTGDEAERYGEAHPSWHVVPADVLVKHLVDSVIKVHCHLPEVRVSFTLLTHLLLLFFMLLDQLTWQQFRQWSMIVTEQVALLINELVEGLHGSLSSELEILVVSQQHDGRVGAHMELQADEMIRVQRTVYLSHSHALVRQLVCSQVPQGLEHFTVLALRRVKLYEP